MRTVEIGSKKYTVVLCLDDPGAGNACHEYEVIANEGVSSGNKTMAWISFQNGPIKENGVNGCHQEDLLAIVLDRLQSFQAGDYSCRENAIAVTKIEEAMLWLGKRTQDRINRGVEGTSIK